MLSGSTNREPTIKALSLWQPWASLVACGAKQIETRHWPTPRALLGQRIAIHATKTRDWLHLCTEEPFKGYVSAWGLLPLGAIVATAVIDRCTEITEQKARKLEQRNAYEFAFGNYDPGRFAWVLRDIQALAEAVPFKGSQGLFDVPMALLGLAPVQAELEVAS